MPSTAKGLCVIAIGVMGAFVAANAFDLVDAPSPAMVAAAHRTLRIQQCLGLWPDDMSIYAWASKLKDEAARTGLSEERWQSLQIAYVESRNPGIVRRCAARVDGG